jgi:hypothetical protein
MSEEEKSQYQNPRFQSNLMSQDIYDFLKFKLPYITKHKNNFF